MLRQIERNQYYLNGHAKIRDAICKLYNVPIKQIPSFYYTIKHRCMMECGTVSILSKHNHLLPETDSEKQAERNNDRDDCAGEKIKVKHRYFSRIAGSCGKKCFDARKGQAPLSKRFI